MNASRIWRDKLAIAAALALSLTFSATAQQWRSLGIDVSAWQGNISTANWITLKRATNQQVGGIYGDGRDFVIIRSSRGGTTGYYNQNDANNANGLNTLSQRYDDPYYCQNIYRATAAGLFAGTYHFARPDIIETTFNSGGIANTGWDEADHMIQMAGPWMRPGFMLPVLDLESGQSQRTSDELTAFCIDFSDRIYARMGVRPMIYINGNYANYVRPNIVAAFPNLWTARWPNQTNPSAIDVQNGHPKDSYAPIYGPWDDPPNPTHPWKFWQYASTAHVNAIGGGTANCDVDVAQGGIDLLKDMLVPALWITNASGSWTTLTNWNSGLMPIAPVQGTGQVARVGTLIMPTPALPGSNDTVILDRPAASVTITLSTGTHTIRKLYVRETLNITGGSLTLTYLPAWDSTPFAAQFSGPVTLSGTGALSLDTLQIDASQTFAINGGTLAFRTINLMPDAVNPAKLSIGGNVTFNFNSTNATATVANGSGAGGSGYVDLVGGVRGFNTTNSMDLFLDVPVSNGGISKTGLGTLRLSKPNSYALGTTLSTGRLLVNNTSGSGTGSGAVTVEGGTLGGTGSIAGQVTVNSIGTIAPGPGNGFGTLTLNSAPVFSGTNYFEINRNGGSLLSDKLILTSGTLTFNGTLVVANPGAALTGGEVFALFSAPSYSGGFGASFLPPLTTGLNWYLGDLTSTGTIKVNRSPVAAPHSFSNTFGVPLEIPLASLLTGATDADGDTITLAGINLTTTNGVTLTTNATAVIFSSNLNAFDQFTYTLSDGHGGTAFGVATIVPQTPGQFLGHPSSGSNSVTLRFVAQPGSTCYVERSTNLPAFVTISTNVVPASGLVDYVDDFHDLPSLPSASFYRLRWAP